MVWSHVEAFGKAGERTGFLSTPLDCSRRLVGKRDEWNRRLPHHLCAGDGCGTDAERTIASNAATGGMDDDIGTQLLRVGPLRAARKQTNGGELGNGVNTSAMSRLWRL